MVRVIGGKYGGGTVYLAHGSVFQITFLRSSKREFVGGKRGRMSDSCAGEKKIDEG
jgi:hypothetical protein